MLHLSGISKRFEAVLALDDVTLEVQAGSVHGVLGANGSGKSTLIKVLSGYHSPEPGAQMRVRGQEVTPPLQPSQLGIAIVHQELGLLEDASVVENVGISSRYGAGRVPLVHWRSERRRTRRILERLGLSTRIEAPVSSLEPAERTIVGIARALRQIEDEQQQAPILLLDEPTVTLPPSDVERLFALMRDIAAGGGCVIFITHRLKEALEICDHATILRDGRVVASRPTAGSSVAELVRAMHDAPLEELTSEATQGAELAGAQTRPAIEARSLTGKTVKDVSFALRPGEVIGVTGLAGMGQDELPYLLAGTSKPAGGEVLLNGEQGKLSGSPWSEGVALVPANRAQHAIWPSGTLSENYTVTRLRDYFRGGRLAHAAERRDTEAAIERFSVRARSADAEVASLSGGNQQKLVLARALASKPEVLLLHEPFIGIDAAARASVLKIIQHAAAEGCAVGLFSIEYELLANVCNRVLVMSNGRKVRELSADSPGSLVESEIVHAAQHA
ncbi:MAG TPA: sugar ABC transporter ATP-binding protein [Solirubrobacteraceae bacterium]|jgi:ribose transport system ATP-binding protein